MTSSIRWLADSAAIFGAFTAVAVRRRPSRVSPVAAATPAVDAPGTPRSEDFDVVGLDCPPTLGHVVIAALAAADEALVPVAAHAMELDGLAAVHRSITTVQRRINPNLRLRVLACRVDHRARATEVVDALPARPGEAVLSTVVRENVRVAEAPQRALSM